MERASVETRSGGRGRSEARERLLATATGLFYGEGIRAVGVDRILAEAPVTRSTFYRHFPSKEDLVLAYLRGVDAETRAGVQAAVEATSSAADAVRAIGSALADALATPGFRGCAFLKAAAEFSDPEDPVRRIVVEHRVWFVDTLTELFAQAYGGSAGRPEPRHAARHFLMMRDGAMSGAAIDGAAEVGAAFRRGVEGLLTVVH
ncbi:MAG TPA: TetR/AcrR family transcriptional regulator [Pseudonocardia sp.]|nr:TetR/AcrR family transcriptional regulator [Pseudonocardia sp.]